MEIELDACLSGVGAKCGSQVYASQLPPGDFNIVHLEMLNTLVSLRVWGDQWSNQKIKNFWTMRLWWQSLILAKQKTEPWQR